MLPGGHIFLSWKESSAMRVKAGFLTFPILHDGGNYVQPDSFFLFLSPFFQMMHIMNE